MTSHSLPTTMKTPMMTRDALTAAVALSSAMQPREGRTPLPTSTLVALMTSQRALAAVAEAFDSDRQALQAQYTKRDDSGQPVRQTQTERTISGEGPTRTETVREVPTSEVTFTDEVAYIKALRELAEGPADVELRQVPLAAVLEAGWEPAGLWPLLGFVLTEGDLEAP